MSSPFLLIARSFTEGRGYTFDSDQPHIKGERHISLDPRVRGEKYVFLGRNGKNERVVIKIGVDTDARREIQHERECRDILSQMRFAYNTFFSPNELEYTEHGVITLFVTEYIEQESKFLERDVREQFRIAVRGLEAQESAHAVAYSHLRQVKKHYEVRDANKYIALGQQYAAEISAEADMENSTLSRASAILEEHAEDVDRYGRFLTHWDFVPHNMRVQGEKIYLLDHASLVFGNKYESWARFINFMALYNPPLADALIAYVRLNRPHEMKALRAMRVFRLLELLWCYALSLKRLSGKEKKLNGERITFWLALLTSVLDDMPLDPVILNAYRTKRDTLRSEEEKTRQKVLH